MSLLGYVLNWTVVSLAIGFGVGLFFLPTLIGVLGDAVPMKKMLGDIHFTIGQILNDGSALVYTDRGAQIVPYNHEARELYVDGEWREAGEVDTVYRLGARPFAITFDPEHAFDAFTADETADDEALYLGESRGGYRGFTPYSDEDGIIVHVARYLKNVGRSGTRLYNRTEEEALKEYGGLQQLGQLWLLGAVVGTMIVMFAMTWVFLSL